MTPFQKAFAAARKAQGAGGEFDFEGKNFSTNYAEDNKKSEPSIIKPELKQEEADPMSQMLQNQFKGKSLNENLNQGKAKIYGVDNDKTSEQDMNYSDAKKTLMPENKEKSIDSKKLGQGLGDIFGGAGDTGQATLNDFNTKTKDVMSARRAALMKMIGG